MRALRRPGGVLCILAAALLGCTSPPEDARAPDEPGATSTICFQAPRLEPPPAEVVARVGAVTSGVPPPLRAWVAALITHESGGVASAVSPTGCAGLLAIQRCDGCRPCCESDGRDRSPGYYDRCSHEAAHGYLCDPRTDPRFGVDFPLRYAERRIAALRRRLPPAQRDGEAFELALAASWNAGSGLFAGYPAGLTSPVAAVERIDFGGTEPYRDWSPRDRWNKLVEIYDYFEWLPYLSSGWFAAGRFAAAPADAGELCFAVGPHRVMRTSRPEGAPQPVEIRRLAFGRYEPATVERLTAEAP